MSRASAEASDRDTSRAEARRKRKEAQRAHKVDAIVDLWPDLMEALEDEMRPFLDLRVKIRDDGSYLGLLKRENDVLEEVLFGGGEDFVEALDSLNKGVRHGRWKESKPWVAD